jgi:hypothetical protein
VVAVGSGGPPAIAAGPAGLLVVFVDPSSRVVGRRYDPSGVAIDAAAFAISEADGFAPASAALEGGGYAVAWTSRAADPRGDIVARVVPEVGPPTAPPVDVGAIAGTAEELPSVAPLAAGAFAILYHHSAPGGFLLRDIAVTAVSGALAPEAADLARELSEDGIEQGGSLARSPDGLWVSFSDDGLIGDPRARRSHLGFLLGVM